MADENPALLKDRWKYTKLVIIGFSDKQALKNGALPKTIGPF